MALNINIPLLIVIYFVTTQIQLGQCSITVITPEYIAGRIFTPAPQYAIGLQEFNVTAEVVVADPIDGCELRNNVTGKIVIAIMDEALCLADIIMNAVLEANGLVSHRRTIFARSRFEPTFKGCHIAL